MLGENYNQHTSFEQHEQPTRPTDWHRLIFDQMRMCGRLRVTEPNKYYDAVMELKNLMIHYIELEDASIEKNKKRAGKDRIKAKGQEIKISTKKRIEEIITTGNSKWKECTQKEKKDPAFTLAWNIENAEKVYQQLVLLISRCGFLPERQMDYVLE